MFDTFYPTALELFEQRGILINDVEYEICEVEFYYYGPGHYDSYSHQHPQSKQYGYWTWHKASNKVGAKYRGGTFKGVDIALGNGSAHYGILIRSIYCDQFGMITGPCNVVDHILSRYGVSSIDEFVGHTDLDITDNHRQFHLVERYDDNGQHRTNIFVGPRVGLNPTRQPEFFDKPYRFATRVELIKKDKRSLTLLL
jgi:hypothetical protein